jgi:hypothetical protein
MARPAVRSGRVGAGLGEAADELIPIVQHLPLEGERPAADRAAHIASPLAGGARNRFRARPPRSSEIHHITIPYA